MELENVLSVGLAVCLLFAIGASSNALSSAVGTNPDEVIDVDYGSLPFSEDQAGDLRDAVTGDSPDEAGRTEGTTGARVVAGEGEETGPVSGSEGEPSDPNGQTEGQGDEHGQAPRDLGNPQPDAGAGEQDGGQKGQSGDEGVGSGPADQQPSLLDQLLALLGKLLPLALLLVALAMLYAFRGRLRRLFAGGGGDDTDRAESVTYVAEPEDEVSAAWFEMVSALGLNQDVAKTPRECERVARETGANASLVHTLTDLYEQVRYAGEPVTDERTRRAREAVEQFKREYGGRRDHGGAA